MLHRHLAHHRHRGCATGHATAFNFGPPLRAAAACAVVLSFMPSRMCTGASAPVQELHVCQCASCAHCRACTVSREMHAAHPRLATMARNEVRCAQSQPQPALSLQLPLITCGSDAGGHLASRLLATTPALTTTAFGACTRASRGRRRQRRAPSAQSHAPTVPTSPCTISLCTCAGCGGRCQRRAPSAVTQSSLVLVAHARTEHTAICHRAALSQHVYVRRLWSPAPTYRERARGPKASAPGLPFLGRSNIVLMTLASPPFFLPLAATS